jgi:cyclopropane-fatty-acyl-phospholipid synthase
VAPVDYRELRGESFDKIASIGMFEHVGRERLPEYFSATFTLLRPGGLFLNHGISSRWAPQSRPLPWRRDGSFTQRYVFPDGELAPISEALEEAERAGLEVRDVESLREHYMMTLRHWVRRLEARKDDAIRIAGEEVYRIWRLFMSGSAYGFATGRLSVFQALLAKPGDGGRLELPLTRAHLVLR